MRYTALALALLWPGDASAQVTLESCNRALTVMAQALPFEMEPAYENVAVDQDTCVFKKLKVEDERMVVVASDLRLRILGDVTAVLSGAGFLDRAQLQIDGLRYFAKTGLPRFDYAYEAIARVGPGISVSLDARHVAGTITLDVLHVVFDPENTVMLSLRIRGADPTDMTAIRIEELMVDVLTYGLFERLLLLTLLDTFLAARDDPAEEVERLRRQALTWAAALPSDSKTRQDLARLLTDMPNPAGRITLRYEGAWGLRQILEGRDISDPAFWADATLRYAP